LKSSDAALLALIEHFDIDFLLPNATNDGGFTALMWMCDQGHTDAMRLMVEKCNGDARRALGDPAAQNKWVGLRCIGQLTATKQNRLKCWCNSLVPKGCWAHGHKKTKWQHAVDGLLHSAAICDAIRKIAEHKEMLLSEEEQKTAATWPAEGSNEKNGSFCGGQGGKWKRLG
jgi:hypothetical protein